MEFRKSWVFAAALVIVAVLLGLLFGIIYEDYRAEREYEKNYQLMQNELISSGLVYEELALEGEIKLLSDKESKRIPTITFIFRSPNKLLSTSIKNVMSGFDMTGTICLSGSSLPGDEGNVTVDEYSALLAMGYSSAVLFDGSMPLGEYLAELRDKLEALGIDFPKVLYVFGKVDNKAYWMFEYAAGRKPIFTNEINEILAENGIECVIQETYQTQKVSYQNFYEPFVYCESLGFNSSQKLSKDSFLETLKSRGALMFSVHFEYSERDLWYGGYYGEYDPSISGSDGTTSDDFLRMLDTIADYGDKIKIADMIEVGEYRESFNAELDLDEETDGRLDSLKSRLVEVKAQILAIKTKYGLE